MDARTFALMIKRFAVDGTAQTEIQELESPRLPNRAARQTDPVSQKISEGFGRQAATQQKRSDWFLSLSESDRTIIRALINDCAEKTAFSLMCLIDGVGGEFDGVFEIVAIDAIDRRMIQNPENSEFLHDLLSEVCEQDRSGS
jgi:hypothetical protein